MFYCNVDDFEVGASKTHIDAYYPTESERTLPLWEIFQPMLTQFEVSIFVIKIG